METVISTNICKNHKPGHVQLTLSTKLRDGIFKTLQPTCYAIFI